MSAVASPLFEDFQATPTLPSVSAERDRLMALVEDRANAKKQAFSADAEAFILRFLAEHGPSSGEILTDATKAAGIKPHDDRAFGPIYKRLAKNGAIHRVGICNRLKGHLTGGGILWALGSGR